MRAFHDWRARTVILLSGVLGNNLIDTQRFARHILECFPLKGNDGTQPNNMESMVQFTADLIKKAVQLDLNLRQSLAEFSWVYRPSDANTPYNFSFQKKTMKNSLEFPHHSKNNAGELTVDLIVSPGLHKRGTADGQNYKHQSCLIKMETICDVIQDVPAALTSNTGTHEENTSISVSTDPKSLAQYEDHGHTNDEQQPTGLNDPGRNIAASEPCPDIEMPNPPPHSLETEDTNNNRRNMDENEAQTFPQQHPDRHQDRNTPSQHATSRKVDDGQTHEPDDVDMVDTSKRRGSEQNLDETAHAPGEKDHEPGAVVDGDMATRQDYEGQVDEDMRADNHQNLQEKASDIVDSNTPEEARIVVKQESPTPQPGMIDETKHEPRNEPTQTPQQGQESPADNEGSPEATTDEPALSAPGQQDSAPNDEVQDAPEHNAPVPDNATTDEDAEANSQATPERNTPVPDQATTADEAKARSEATPEQSNPAPATAGVQAGAETQETPVSPATGGGESGAESAEESAKEADQKAVSDAEAGGSREGGRGTSSQPIPVSSQEGTIEEEPGENKDASEMPGSHSQIS